MIASPRRHVLCIRPRFNSSAGEILTVTSNEWVEALALHADVTSVEGDFDFDAVCNDLKPDLVVLDAVNWTRPWPLEIAKARSHPDIPRVLFLNSDPHDPMRTLTMRMADELGIDTVFITGEAYRQHMPALKHRTCFFVPQFIDDTIYRDYGLQKSVPVSIFGGHLQSGFYAWRAQFLAEAPRAVPTLIYPHPGYEQGAVKPFSVRGEAYARLLNQCHFSAADTTRLDYGVRKHIEIPACGSVLIAPDSDALASYGFVDMENCVLGSGNDLFDKILDVARDPSVYERVRRAGMALVSKRYTRISWHLMLDWLDCRARLKPGQIIQQVGRYGPFRGVTPNAKTATLMAKPQRDNDMAKVLRAAQAAILTNDDMAGAEASLAEASNWLAHMAEPFFMLGVFQLLRGQALEAAMAVGRRPQGQGSLDVLLGTLDPVETSWLLIIARLLGNPDLEAAMREQAATSAHLSLRRALWLLDTPDLVPDASLLSRQPGDQLSVHWLGEEDFTAWCDLIRRVFMANRAGAGRTPFADQPGSAAA